MSSERSDSDTGRRTTNPIDVHIKPVRRAFAGVVSNPCSLLLHRGRRGRRGKHRVWMRLWWTEHYTHGCRPLLLQHGQSLAMTVRNLGFLLSPVPSTKQTKPGKTFRSSRTMQKHFAAPHFLKQDSSKPTKLRCTSHFAYFLCAHKPYGCRFLYLPAFKHSVFFKRASYNQTWTILTSTVNSSCLKSDLVLYWLSFFLSTVLVSGLACTSTFFLCCVLAVIRCFSSFFCCT